ncbi:phosphate-starvation-inducible protein PsiE [Enterococcus sp. JM4C]|uniref:phosphate-starvation-inducible protein PsiE n=1 Tax=Candidatus Enterococcus huntleyi TaxID=1857217 RepID=UPI001379AC51|nr:phosphate-starvation-inducible protein PsiE [Enterococcus sp. JM4C]KAF1298125.1 phosphate-starvation-inducible protein PsiE [Enterococcus sp. JM4C]
MNFTLYKKILDRIIDLILGVASVFIIIYMIRYLADVGRLIFDDVSTDNFELFIQEITAFFMLFEFVVMLIRYIQEGHHIPIRYLVLISMTAILRQLLVVHDNGLQTLLLAASIILLAAVLTMFTPGSRFSFHGQTKKPDEVNSGDPKP